jgi:hypothetical protein
VLVKDSANSPWRVDVSFGSNYLRTEALTVVTVTTDATGKVLWFFGNFRDEPLHVGGIELQGQRG